MKISAFVFLSFLLPFTNAQGDLEDCDAFRSGLKTRINGWKNRGEDINTVVSFICESSFRDNLEEEMNNGLAGTPMLSIDRTLRCEGRRSSDNVLCRDIFANESTKSKDSCIKHNGCIFDEPKCRGSALCKVALADFPYPNLDSPSDVDQWDQQAFNRCTNADSNCHYEPAPRTNVCIQKDLNGNFYNNPTHRNLLEQAFHDKEDCHEQVRRELLTGHRRRHRRLSEEGSNDDDNDVMLEYAAIILDANDQKNQLAGENLDAEQINILNEQLKAKKGIVNSWYKSGWKPGFYDKYVIAIEGKVESVDNDYIRGWSCDTYTPYKPNNVEICFGAPRGNGCNRRNQQKNNHRTISAKRPSSGKKKACGGTGNHGFVFEMDDSTRKAMEIGDGKIYVYGTVGPLRAWQRKLRWKYLQPIEPLHMYGTQIGLHNYNDNIGEAISIEQELNEVEQEVSNLVHDIMTHDEDSSSENSSSATEEDKMRVQQGGL